MAGRLIDAGHRVTVWNRDRSKSEPFKRRGARIADNPADAARSGIVLSMLANDDALEAVSFGDSGLLAAAPRLLHVSCSTGSCRADPATDRCAWKGRPALCLCTGAEDPRCSGGRSPCRSSPPAPFPTWTKCNRCSDAIGSKTIRMGERPVMAAASKAAANFGIAAIIETLSEQIRIVAAQGVPASKMVELLVATDFGNRMIGVYGPMIAEQRFEPAGFPLKLGRKDIGLAIMAATNGGLPHATCSPLAWTPSSPPTVATATGRLWASRAGNGTLIYR